MRKFNKFTNITYKLFVYSKMPLSSLHVESEAREIFHKAVKSVQPKSLLEDLLQVSPTFLKIKEKQFPLNDNVHVVGFGKAVLGMASAVEKILGDHLQSGIISVPLGISSNIKFSELPRKIQVLEGALNNLPDEKSMAAASKISKFISQIDRSHLIIVLISGGGSALLPAPKPPLTLGEKQKVISLLASKGATIEELNIIRKRLSTLKGGGLALLAKPAQVVSFIISDIIDDPLHLIASAPTFKNTDDPSLPLEIINKYSLRDKMPLAALQILENLPKTIEKSKKDDDDFNHVFNFIIGNNKTALKAAAAHAKTLEYEPIILTSKLRGTACTIGSLLMRLADAFIQQDETSVCDVAKNLGLTVDTIKNLKKALIGSNKNGKYCLLLGGETTVEISGSGVGGRSQELALAAAIELLETKHKNCITLLSAGTDGIDGPTTAAGALATSTVVQSAKVKGAEASQYLNNNDSYNFFALAENGRWHVETGHTGTNVMDIVIILIERKQE